MARVIFWPTQDSYVMSIGGYPNAGIAVKIWSRQSGGSQVTDLVYVNFDGSLGAAVPSGVLITDSNGLLPTFAGPDNGPTTMWGDHGFQGERLALTSGPTPSGVGGAVTSVVGQTGSVTGTQILADSTVAAALTAKAPTASPTLTGTPVAPTASPGTNTTQVATTAFVTAAVGVGSDSWLKAQALDPGDRLTGTITRNGDNAATTASYLWDDGTVGVYTSDAFNATSPGMVDGWHVTYPGSPTKTVTQPTMTRNASGGLTARPALTVS